MRLLIFSDLHCHNWNDFHRTLSDGRNSRLADCLGIIDKAGEVAQQQRCDAIIFLGDLFESRTKIDNDVMFYAIEGMRNLSQKLRLYMLRGNHDCFDDLGKVDSLAGFRDFATVLRAPFQMMAAPDPDTILTFIPWHSQPKDVFEILSGDLNPNQKNILFMHQSVSEGFIGLNKQVHGSLDLKDIPIDKCVQVFAGDYHRAQTLSSHGKFMYVGSPLQLNFGEAGQPKSFVIYDTVTNEVECVLTDAPQFYEFDVYAAFVDAVNSNEFNLTRDFVKVHYTKADEENVDQWFGRVSHLTFEFKPDAQLEERCDPSVVTSDVRLLDEYMDQRAAELPKADRDALLADGLEMLSGV